MSVYYYWSEGEGKQGGREVDPCTQGAEGVTELPGKQVGRTVTNLGLKLTRHAEDPDVRVTGLLPIPN